jgi:hypothetical protein
MVVRSLRNNALLHVESDAMAEVGSGTVVEAYAIAMNNEASNEKRTKTILTTFNNGRRILSG